VQITADIFIGSIIAIMAAYSFIIGRNGVLRIIFATYFAVLATDGFIGLVVNHVLGFSPILTKISDMLGSEGIASFKIFIFILLIVVTTVRGAFTIDLPNEKSVILKLVTTSFVGLLSANLIISVLLVYISGGSFIFQTNSVNADLNLMAIYQNSLLAKTLISNFNISFLLPVVTFIILGLIYNEN